MKLHDASPFRIVDPGFNAVLLRSCIYLADLADELGDSALALHQRALAEQGLDALETLWSEAHQQYLCYDRVTNGPIEAPRSAD